jgi:hypothetical protein
VYTFFYFNIVLDIEQIDVLIYVNATLMVLLQEQGGNTDQPPKDKTLISAKEADKHLSEAVEQMFSIIRITVCSIFFPALLLSCFLHIP